MAHPRILLTTGEPAGIGPELCLDMARLEWPALLVAVGDAELLRQRAAQVGSLVEISAYHSSAEASHQPGHLPCISIPLNKESTPGQLDPANSAQVVECIRHAAKECLAGSFDACKGSACSWLLAMVHHRSIDKIRRRRDKTQMNPQMELEQPGTEAGVWLEVMGNLDRQIIDRALDQIPAEQRQAIELAFYGGYTHQELSDDVQLPLGTVKSRIRMGMEKLRDLLKHQ
ncbi:MAG: sigma-70 family RNA polymerase sigma factor, partial [Proteobacteria bacterium]|nr:sigma-70 family RNA polymerase sigma factor [Pseudomonadota bacterium]